MGVDRKVRCHIGMWKTCQVEVKAGVLVANFFAAFSFLQPQNVVGFANAAGEICDRHHRRALALALQEAA